MGSAQFQTFTDTPSFWKVAEDEHRGIQVIRLHPKAKISQFEERVRAEFPHCEVHWPRPDPGSESEHRGDCWLVFPGAGDATRALGVLRGWKFWNWHIKTKRAKKEMPPAGTPALPQPSINLLPPTPPPLPPLLLPEPTVTTPSHPIAFVNTTNGDF